MLLWTWLPTRSTPDIPGPSISPLGQLARYLFGTFEADKEEWEKNKASQQGVGPTDAGETDPSGRAE